MRQLNYYEKAFVAGGSRWTKWRDKTVDVAREIGVSVERIEQEAERLWTRVDKENYRSTMRGFEAYYEERRKKTGD